MSKSEICSRDLPKILSKFYKQSGNHFPRNTNHSLIDLIEWVIRIPSNSPRNIYSSNELNKKILTLFEIKGLNEIKKIITMGGDLKPYLGDITKSIRNRSSNKNDFFSSDWGLLHLHLGADFENKKTRVSRSKRVLIARFEGNSAYLIDVVNHGRGYSSVWGDVSHLEILYRNWPSILGEGMRQAGEDKSVISATDYIKLRHSGINTTIFINGKVFIAPGLGIATDGSQIEAVQVALNINKNLEKAEIEFRKKEPLAKAFLVLKNDFSVGFLVPEKNEYFCYFKISENNEVANLFHRFLLEIPLVTDKSYHQFITPKRIKK